MKRLSVSSGAGVMASCREFDGSCRSSNIKADFVVCSGGMDSLYVIISCIAVASVSMNRVNKADFVVFSGVMDSLYVIISCIAVASVSMNRVNKADFVVCSGGMDSLYVIISCIAVASVSMNRVNKAGESGHPRLVPVQ